MSKIKQRRVLNSVLVVIIAFLFGLISLFALLPKTNVFAQADSGSDADVGNYSSMSTDVIYQIVTDRFVDGDPSNNPTGEIYDKNNLRKYHGGDWAGITQKLNENYFTNMGVTALWISSPVQNSDYIDPSNGCAPYHGYWGRDFFLCAVVWFGGFESAERYDGSVS